MAQPATGVSFKASGLGALQTQRIRRGGNWSLLVRDYDGINTNLSPGVFGAPMALDGNWRDDLLAVKVNAQGKMVYNNAENLGFHLLGCNSPDGYAQEHDFNDDELEILQSIDPARVDLQSRSKKLTFTGFENKPLLHRLINDEPLTDILDVGAGTYWAGESATIDFVERQFILLHQDKAAGKLELVAYPLPRYVRASVGKLVGTKSDPLAAELSYKRLIDPYFVDDDGAPLTGGVWVAGPGWDESISPGFTFVPPKPVATATAAATATLVFKAPIGGVSPYTYTVQKSASADMTSPSSATVGTTTVNAGVVTLSLTGLTTATTSYFRVTATDSTVPAGVAVTSMVSNPATQP